MAVLRGELQEAVIWIDCRELFLQEKARLRLKSEHYTSTRFMTHCYSQSVVGGNSSSGVDVLSDNYIKLQPQWKGR